MQRHLKAMQEHLKAMQQHLKTMQQHLKTTLPPFFAKPQQKENRPKHTQKNQPLPCFCLGNG